jgi:hypothetical protein
LLSDRLGSRFSDNVLVPILNQHLTSKFGQL